MKRQRYSARTAGHLAGVLAQHDGHCWICDQPIHRLASQVVLRRGDWIHTTCAPGADDA